LDLRHPVQGLAEPLLQRVRVATRLGDQAGGAAVFLAEQREQQVRRLDLLVVTAEREALGVGQALLQLRGELVLSHGVRSNVGAEIRSSMGAIVSSQYRRRPTVMKADGRTEQAALALQYARVRGETEARSAGLSAEDCAAQSMPDASPVK